MDTLERDGLLQTLEARFARHPGRHPGITWSEVQARLLAATDKLATLQAMEASGGEPDVVVLAGCPEPWVYCDCAAESPAGRRSLCYDPDSLDARKEAKPAGSALGLARDMGIELLDETRYRALQQLDEFDCKTSSWILTPPPVRALGGALFGDRRYGRVFTYHNGAGSYYGARGFRGWLAL